MKKILTGILLILIPLLSYAQNKPIKVVFDVTSKDTSTHQATMRHVIGMAKAYPDSEFEVVVYGGAISMVMKEKSTVKDDIISFKDNSKVTFKVCGGTMQRYQVGADALIPGVDVVQDGILEIVTRQGEGWGYIKEAH